MLIFGLHCHQPVDNFGWIVDEAINKCYSPLINKLIQYPNFKFSIHISGWLFEYIRTNAKEIFEKLKIMSNLGQIEFFSGGFYEPILEAIPKQDRIQQIRMMNNYIEQHFNQIPKGLWLTERVFSNNIIEDIVDNGIEYIAIDDIFINDFSYTIFNNKILKLLPISKQLRYAIPFKDVERVKQFINTNSSNIIFDDCEKFGLWPKTYDWVYKKGWIDDFLSSGITTVLPKEYVKTHKPSMVYLPNHSYQEMEEWSLGVDEFKEYKKIKGLLADNHFQSINRFIRGGIWQNFLKRYFESNWIQKRVVYLSRKKIDSDRYNDYLFKAQNNDVLWHGIFGGIYLPNLRDNAYRYIISCENMLKDGGLEVLDIDLDLNDEYKYKGKNYIAIFNSDGELIELDDRDNLFNFQNTLRRYKEKYHLNKKEQDDFDTIHNQTFDFYQFKIEFDNYYRFSFITKKDNFDTKVKNKTLNFIGKTVTKRYNFQEDRIDFSFTGSTQIEFNLHLANDYQISKDSNSCKIFDSFTNRTIVIKFNNAFEVETQEIITYSLKESGIDSIKQGVCLMFRFNADCIEGSLCLK